MIDTIKNLAQAKAKMSKKLGIHDPENYVLYFKILGTQWTRCKIYTLSSLLPFVFFLSKISDRKNERNQNHRWHHFCFC